MEGRECEKKECERQRLREKKNVCEKESARETLVTEHASAGVPRVACHVVGSVLWAREQNEVDELI